MAGVLEIGEAQFEAEVIKSDRPVLVDFWAPWCGPCQMIAPVLEELAADKQGSLKVVKINVDENPDLASRFGVMGIPTLMLFKGGEAVDSFTGAMPKQVLAEKVEKHL